LIAGVVFGAIMQLMSAPTSDGRQMPMLAMIGQIVGSPTVGVGWLYHLFNSAVIGAIFGWLLGNRVHSYAPALGWGAAYGFFGWIVGGLVLMPLLLGMPAFAPLMMPSMVTLAMGSLAGHLIYGVSLGAAFVWLRYGARVGRHSAPDGRCEATRVKGASPGAPQGARGERSHAQLTAEP
jgi:hypothetical protein